jgi:hypothetical protein
VVEVQSKLALPKALQINGSIKYIDKNNLEGRLHSHYFTLTDSLYQFSNKAVELQFLVLPCLKSDIQRHLMSNNGTMSEDVLQKLIYNHYIIGLWNRINEKWFLDQQRLM